MDKVCPDAYSALSYEETSRARAGLQGVKFFNVGLKNTTFNSRSETYRTLTGPQAERAVTAGDGRAYVQGHFFGSGLDGEEKETIGASSSSRIWSNQRLTVVEFLEWVERLNARLSGNAPFAETHLDIVRATTTLRRLPDLVIAGTWPRAGFQANPKVRYRTARDNEVVVRRLTDWELCNFESRPDQGQLLFSITSEVAEVRMCLTVGQGRMVTTLDAATVVEVESAIDLWMPLADWLSLNPPRFYSADKSSFEGMNLMAAPLLQIEALQPGDAEVINWDGCAIRVEFLIDDGSQESIDGRARLAGKLTVQEHLEQHLLNTPNLVALFYDHRTGEAADYISVTNAEGGEVTISLYHCKGAGGDPSGGRVGDVYEVAGQLVKSVFYCEVSTLLAHMEDRMHLRHASPSIFVRGDMDSLRELLEEVPQTKLTFTIVGVQPGISRGKVDAHLADLMAFGINYARQGGAAKAYWLISN